MKTPIDMGTELSKLMCKKDEAKRSPVERGAMAHAFMEECYKKFLRKAKENNRTLTPWKDETMPYLSDRLVEEKTELFDAIFDKNLESIMDECLDVANFVWFIYENAKARLETGP